VGSQTAREFLDRGWEVRGLDRNTPPKDLRDRMEVVYAELTDRLALLRAAHGCDAIAHLAAIPSPGAGDPPLIFPSNVTGTQYILEAARANGINRVALASTCCAFGIFFAIRPIDPQWLPMDETHPSLPQDLYGLSKHLNEQTAAAYTSAYGMTTVALRLTTVFDLERSAQGNDWWIRRQLTNDDRRNDLWTYIDIKDAARAFYCAITNGQEGTHTTAIIAARDSYTGRDIRDLVRQHFPALAEGVAHLGPSDCLYNTELAEKAFGFVAERHWRDFPGLVEAAKG
jgi:nucleoside-diphosphate-sugar epimerase